MEITELKELYKQKCEQISVIKNIGNDILKLPKEEFSYNVAFLTSQSAGCLVEKYIIKRMGGVKIPAKMGRGDMENDEGCWEIKSSIINNTNNSINLVQLRPWQELTGYIINIIDMKKNEFNGFHTLRLTKNDMIDECVKLNAGAAHGTKDIADKNTHTELRFSIRYGSDTYKEWIEKYEIHI